MIDLTFNMSDGDLDTILDDDNMISACIRRLDTRLDTTLYEDYGSDLKELLGLKKSDVNLQFMEHSINECLSQDERLTDISVNCKYTVDGILADIGIVYEDNIIDFTYESSTDGVDTNSNDDGSGDV